MKFPVSYLGILEYCCWYNRVINNMHRCNRFLKIFYVYDFPVERWYCVCTNRHNNVLMSIMSSHLHIFYHGFVTMCILSEIQVFFRVYILRRQHLVKDMKTYESCLLELDIIMKIDGIFIVWFSDSCCLYHRGLCLFRVLVMLPNMEFLIS